MSHPARLALAALTLLLVLVTATAAAEPTVVRPDPLQTDVRAGGTFVVNLYVQGVADLYAADIHLLFDPTILQVEDARPEVPGVQIQPLATFLSPDFVIKQKACSAPNVIVLIVRPADSCGMPWPNSTRPPAMAQPVAAITFRAIRAGSSPDDQLSQAFQPERCDIPSTLRAAWYRCGYGQAVQISLPFVFR